MARDTYNNTIVQRKDDGNLAALGNVQVTVVRMFDNQDATIYQSRLGAAQGPTAGSGGTGANPFTTGSSGSVEFWADLGEYQIKFHDLTNPPRFADYSVGWMAIPAGFGTLPGVMIDQGGTLPFNALDALAKRQFTPIGGVISWWRPSATFDAGAGVGLPPPGWEVCDGRAIGQSNHDFGAIGSITLPDMRNAFDLGADITKAQDQAGVGNGATEGPGIGSDPTGAHYRAFNHSHTVNNHSHGSITELSALSVVTSQAGGHVHANVLGTALASASPTGVFNPGIGSTPYNLPNHTHSVSSGTDNSGNHAHFVQQHNHVIPPEQPGTSQSLSAIQDIRPRHIGMLRIMKVKRS